MTILGSSDKNFRCFICANYLDLNVKCCFTCNIDYWDFNEYAIHEECYEIFLFSKVNHNYIAIDSNRVVRTKLFNTLSKDKRAKLNALADEICEKLKMYKVFK